MSIKPPPTNQRRSSAGLPGRASRGQRVALLYGRAHRCFRRFDVRLASFDIGNLARQSGILDCRIDPFRIIASFAMKPLSRGIDTIGEIKKNNQIICT